MKQNLKLKICGMREPENIQVVANLLPDYMGFIFYKNSPRYVGDNFKMQQPIPDSIKKVGVFINESTDRIQEMVRQHKLDFVQLHGSEPAEDCQKLKVKGVKVIKAFSIHDEFNFSVLHSFEPVVDFFLFDTKGKFLGGNNEAFNWGLLIKYNQHVPFFLSGGLSSVNIQNVMKLSDMNIHALDFNSGVELCPGLKNVSKIKDVQNFLTRDSQFLTTNS